MPPSDASNTVAVRFLADCHTNLLGAAGLLSRFGKIAKLDATLAAETGLVVATFFDVRAAQKVLAHFEDMAHPVPSLPEDFRAVSIPLKDDLQAQVEQFFGYGEVAGMWRWEEELVVEFYDLRAARQVMMSIPASRPRPAKHAAESQEFQRSKIPEPRRASVEMAGSAQEISRAVVPEKNTNISEEEASSLCEIDIQPVNYIEKPLSSGNVLGLLALEEKGLTFQVRYVTMWIQRGFQDAESGQWGTTIRDFGVLQFSNMVRGKVPIVDSLWEYPAAWTVDNSMDTEWTSRFGALEAQLIYDLGYRRNIAGMTWVFGHVAGRVDVHYADRNDNRSNWQRAYSLIGNVATDIVVPTTVHFKCRFIRLTLHEPRTREFWHPDRYEDTEYWDSLLSLKDFKAYEHTGGGGVLGFQSVDGMEYTTIAYGLRQPGEWIISSEVGSGGKM
ncbi:unnamed protein product [Symbiodinium natans]|uniref:F5/8 type C domain-containing protein n=1 Tax=Symbiodinium natans TaxID=878477 RepID=A0A812TZU6_9DINO|nr:unnamed protein product [Symbiodinium natans]